MAATGIMSLIEQNLRLEILAVIWILKLWEHYLRVRQERLMKKLVERPDSLENIMTKDVYNKAHKYALARLHFSTIEDFYSAITVTVFIVYFVTYHFWEWSLAAAEWLHIPKSEIPVSCICMFIICLVSTILHFPFKVYETFVLEQEHGFNKQTPGFFVKDQIKKFVVTQALSLPFMSGMLWIVQNGGDYFFFYVWIFTVLVTLFLMIIYPEVIAPLFDKYTPLPEGELKRMIEGLAASVNYPLYKIFVVEGSKRSSHSNAYMYGFYKHKRIVLFDTLVKEYYEVNKKEDENEESGKKDQGCENDEVVAVLGHELGHWKYNHTLKGFLIAQVNFVMNFLPFAKLLHYKPMYVAFGFTTSQPIFIGLLIVTVYIMTPLNTLLGFLLTIYSRRMEFQADNFAKQLGYADPLKRALLKLQKDNLGYPLFDKLYSSWRHNHPPIIERIEVLDKKDN